MNADRISDDRETAILTLTGVVEAIRKDGAEAAMTFVEDPSVIEYIADVLAALAELCAERDDERTAHEATAERLAETLAERDTLREALRRISDDSHFGPGAGTQGDGQA